MSTENKQEILHVGVRKNPDGSLDFSRAARWVKPHADDFAEKYRQLLSPKQESFSLPPHWTTLYHGSNLSRPYWQGANAALLDAPTLTINSRALSVISEAEKQKQQSETDDLRSQGVAQADGGTTKAYAMEVNGGENKPVEIQIAFPDFHRRTKKLEGVEAAYLQKYGSDHMKRVFDLCDKVFWHNRQSGRHPLMPSGMVLAKVSDTIRADGVRVIQYVPDALKDLYMREMTEKE